MTARAENATSESIPEPRLAGVGELSPELELLLARFRLLATLRLGWLEKLWSEEGAPSTRAAISRGEIEANLADRDSPQAESSWLEHDESSSRYSVALSEVEASLASDHTSRLAQISTLFGLGVEELDLLQACASVALGP